MLIDNANAQVFWVVKVEIQLVSTMNIEVRNLRMETLEQLKSTRFVNHSLIAPQVAKIALLQTPPTLIVQDVVFVFPLILKLVIYVLKPTMTLSNYHQKLLLGKLKWISIYMAILEGAIQVKIARTCSVKYLLLAPKPASRDQIIQQDA